MKTFAGVLYLFAVGGMGLGLVMLATKAFQQAHTFADTLGYALIPMVLGLIAWSGVTITMAIDEAKVDQAARLDRIAALLEKRE